MRTRWKIHGVFAFSDIDSLLKFSEKAPADFVPEKDINWFNKLKDKSPKELKSYGMKEWNDGIWLFPASWYDVIPNGFTFTDIFEKEESFQHGKTDSDQRFGCLAYGVKIK